MPEPACAAIGPICLQNRISRAGPRGRTRGEFLRRVKKSAPLSRTAAGRAPARAKNVDLANGMRNGYRGHGAADMLRRSILCPVDSSDASRGALRFAATIAEHFYAGLTVTTIGDPPLSGAAEMVYGAGAYEKHIRAEARSLRPGPSTAAHQPSRSCISRLPFASRPPIFGASHSKRLSDTSNRFRFA